MGRPAAVVPIRQAGGPGESAIQWAARAKSPATKRAYAVDWRAWREWCEGAGRDWRAPSPGDVADWIAGRADGGAAPASLARALAGFAAGARAAGGAIPDLAAARAVVSGVARARGAEPRQARPLLAGELSTILRAIPRGRRASLADVRDRALLAAGWQGALRRSELCGLEWGDLDLPGGAVTLRASKGARDGRAVRVAIVAADDRACCPLATLAVWRRRLGARRAAAVTHGAPVFVALRGETPGESALGGAAVTRILRARAAAAGVAVGGLSAHSLRAGMATSAALSGVDIWRLARHTRHASIETLNGYVRVFMDKHDHPARGLL